MSLTKTLEVTINSHEGTDRDLFSWVNVQASEYWAGGDTSANKLKKLRETRTPWIKSRHSNKHLSPATYRGYAGCGRIKKIRSHATMADSFFSSWKIGMHDVGFYPIRWYFQLIWVNNDTNAYTTCFACVNWAVTLNVRTDFF